MSCKSALFTVNDASTAYQVGSTVPFGAIVRRFGCNADLNGSGIIIRGSGYYDVSVSVTAAPTAAGTVTVAMLKDGVAVPGMTASQTVAAAGNPTNLALCGLIREQCCDSSSTLTLQLTGAASTVSNVAAVIEKV